MNRAVTVSLLLALGGLGTIGYFHPDLLPFPSRKHAPPKWVASALPPPPVVAPDESLTEDQYSELAIPDLGRAWTEQDLAIAVLKLSALAASHPEQLPRYQSPKSGRIFAKLVDPQSLGLLQQIAGDRTQV